MSRLSNGFSQQKERRREWVGWLIWVGHLTILYWLANVYWHVNKVFLFVGLFIGLHLLVAIAFKLLYTQVDSSE